LFSGLKVGFARKINYLYTNNSMQIQDIMTKKVISVSPEMKMCEVAEILTSNRIHGVPVVENQKIVGIVTETDFFTKESSLDFHLPSYIKFIENSKLAEKLPEDKESELEKLMSATARDIMTSDCVIFKTTDSIEDLFDFFKKTNHHTVPVIDEREFLVGVVTLSDLIKMLKV